MRRGAVVAILALAFTVHAVTDEEVYTSMKKMETSRYGKTLLDTIQLQLTAGGPVEDLIRMLQQTEDELQAEQDADDAFIAQLQEQCDAELAKLQTEIQQATKRIGELDAELKEKIPIREEKNRIRNEKINFRQAIRDRIAEINANKEIKDAEWAEEQAQHDQAQYVIERAKQIIVESLKSSSFLQKKSGEVLAQVSTHFSKHAKSAFKRKSWNQIFNLLSQITAAAPIQADQSLVQKVVDLCDKLLTKISESREIERRDYQHWLEEYQTTFNQLNDKDQVLTAEINQLESEIDTLTKRINAATAEKRDTEVRRDQKQSEYNERLAYCDQENVNYSNRRQQRYDEIEVVSDAVSLLQSHLRLFRQYVNERIQGIQKAA